MGVTVTDHFFGVERSDSKQWLGWALSRTTACRHDLYGLGEATPANMTKFEALCATIPDGKTDFLDEMETQFGTAAKTAWLAMTSTEQADMWAHVEWMHDNGFLPT